MKVRRVMWLLSSIFLNFLLFPIILFSSKRITYPEELWASLLGPLALSFLLIFILSGLFLFLILNGSSLLSIYQLKRLDFSFLIFNICVFALIVILLPPEAITIASCAPPAGGQMVPFSSGSGNHPQSPPNAGISAGISLPPLESSSHPDSSSGSLSRETHGEEDFVSTSSKFPSPSTSATSTEEGSPSIEQTDSLRFINESEFTFWQGQVIRAVKDSLDDLNHQKGYNIGTIPDRQIVEALGLDVSLRTQGEMEFIVFQIRKEWPNFINSDRASIYYKLWMLVEQHQRPAE